MLLLYKCVCPLSMPCDVFCLKGCVFLPFLHSLILCVLFCDWPSSAAILEFKQKVKQERGDGRVGDTC